MLNLDAETEGEFLVSCAGGQTVLLDLPLAQEEELTCLEVSLKGFRGGHSGIEIDKGRLNAIKELGQWLKRHGARLAGLEAPNKFNAISRRATALVTAESADTLIKDHQSQQALWWETEPEAQLVIREPGSMKPLSPGASEALMALINGLPNGIYTLSPDLPGLVESSSNLGVITQEEDQLSLSVSIQSSAPDKMNEIEQTVRDLAGRPGPRSGCRALIPAGPMRRTVRCGTAPSGCGSGCSERAPHLNAIHAGLECGVIKSNTRKYRCCPWGPTCTRCTPPGAPGPCFHGTDGAVYQGTAERTEALTAFAGACRDGKPLLSLNRKGGRPCQKNNLCPCMLVLAALNSQYVHSALAPWWLKAG